MAVCCAATRPIAPSGASRHARLAAVGLSLGVAACLPVAPPPPLPPAADQPGDFASAYYESRLAAGERVFRLSEDSRVTLLVYRSGRAARLGHNHVISARHLGGYAHLADDVADSRIDLFLRPAEWIVDDPLERAAAGDAFATALTERAVTGTRANMLGDQVLDAAAHPFITVTGTVERVRADELTTRLDIGVRGARHTVTAPARWSRRGERLRIRAEFTVRQTALGITPLSVLGGSLVVRDGVVVQADLVGERLPPAEGPVVSVPNPSDGALRVRRKSS